MLTHRADPSAVVASLDKVDGVQGAAAPQGPQWRTHGYAEVLAFSHSDDSTTAGRDAVDRIRTAAHEAGPDVTVGGLPAQNVDFINAVYSGFPLMIALIATITFILLARAFRSLLLPAKAVILNIVSVTAAWGVIALMWQHGYGSDLLWNIEATGRFRPGYR